MVPSHQESFHDMQSPEQPGHRELSRHSWAGLLRREGMNDALSHRELCLGGLALPLGVRGELQVLKNLVTTLATKTVLVYFYLNISFSILFIYFL